MEISVKIEPDADGYTGRECPTCEKYFKIKFGTGLPGSPPCHCPYCNHTGPQEEFWTKQQIEYARSVAMYQVSGQFLKQLKKLERRPDPRAMISIGMTVNGSPTPIAHSPARVGAGGDGSRRAALDFGLRRTSLTEW